MTDGLWKFLRQHAVGLVALFVALGGTSYAVAGKRVFVGSGGEVRACVRSATGSVRLVVKTAKCRRGEQSVTWNQRGVGGAAGGVGAAGAKGERGESGPTGSIQGAAAAGDLTGSYPAPTIAAPSAPTPVGPNPNIATDPCFLTTPQNGVYCGTSVKRWLEGSFGFGGIEFWRDRLGAIHIRGAARLSSGSGVSTVALFRLPPGLRPSVFQALPIATGFDAGVFPAGSALLVVRPDGSVAIVSPSSATDNSVLEVVPTVVELRAGGRLSEFSQTVEAATSGVAVAMVV